MYTQKGMYISLLKLFIKFSWKYNYLHLHTARKILRGTALLNPAARTLYEDTADEFSSRNNFKNQLESTPQTVLFIATIFLISFAFYSWPSGRKVQPYRSEAIECIKHSMSV